MYERVERLEELLKNQARRTKVSRLVDDCLDLKSKVSERNEILMSTMVEAVVSEASASSNKVIICGFVPILPVNNLSIEHSLVSLLVCLLKSRQLRPNVLGCC